MKDMTLKLEMLILQVIQQLQEQEKFCRTSLDNEENTAGSSVSLETLQPLQLMLMIL